MIRINVASGAPWEDIAGYSRAVRAGDHVFVTGTTAAAADGGPLPGTENDAYAQTVESLRKIERALELAGASLRDVVRTRLFVTDIERDWRAVSRAHAEHLGEVRPATSLVQVARLIAPWMLVEVEADAVVGAGAAPPRWVGREDAPRREDDGSA